MRPNQLRGHESGTPPARSALISGTGRARDMRSAAEHYAAGRCVLPRHVCVNQPTHLLRGVFFYYWNLTKFFEYNLKENYELMR